ncbi:MAG: DEAD/DEAH box helicase [Candidatus Berkiellales bacterium]
MTFNTFGLPPFLLQSLDRLAISTPTEIQLNAIPPGLEGRDILASAQTGTGKTLAYLIPILSKLQTQPQSSALILTPTRELAAQVNESVQQLIGRLQLNTALLIGGEPMFKQFRMLKRHPRIIIGTPGRIIDHLERRSLELNEAEFVVLDEADRMLDMGFVDALKLIARYLPEKRQTFMFSATLPASIVKLSQNYLNNPQRIAIGSTTQPVTKIKQEMIQTSHAEKFSHLLKELEQREGSVIIFVKTKIGADKLADKLKDQGLSVAAIHGDLKQRRRDQVIQGFRNEQKRILVATDVAARGLDIPHLKIVINYDLPQCPEDYIHRIGRTGRNGMEGSALTFVSPDERWKWKAIHQLINSENGMGLKEEGNRNSNKSNHRNDYKRNSNSGSERRNSYGRKSDSGETRSYGRNDSSGERRNSYGRKSDSGETRSYGRKSDSGENRSYARRSDSGEGRRSYPSRSDSGEGRRSYASRSDSGENHNNYGRKSDSGENRNNSYGRKSDNGEGRRSYANKTDSGEGRRSYASKSDSGEGRRSYPSKSDSGENRNNYGRKSDSGEGRRSYASKSDSGENRNNYGRKSDSGEGRRSYPSKSDSGEGRRSYASKSDSGESRISSGQKFERPQSQKRQQHGFKPTAKVAASVAQQKKPKRIYVPKRPLREDPERSEGDKAIH